MLIFKSPMPLTLRGFFRSQMAIGWIVMSAFFAYMTVCAPFLFTEHRSHGVGAVPGTAGAIFTSAGIAYCLHHFRRHPALRMLVVAWLRWYLVFGVSFGLVASAFWILAGLIALPIREAFGWEQFATGLGCLFGYGLGMPALAMLLTCSFFYVGVPLAFVEFVTVGLLTDFANDPVVAMWGMAMAVLVIPAWLWGPDIAGRLYLRAVWRGERQPIEARD